MVKKSVITIRQKTDKSLLRICSRKFAASEYSDIIRAYLVLDYMSETLKVPLCLENDSQNYISNTNSICSSCSSSNTMDGDISIFDTKGCMEGLAERVLRFLNKDIELCLHTAVVEFLYASQHRKEKAAKEMDMLRAFSPMG